LPLAVLAVEDRRFYEHFGVDVLGLLRAAVANLRAGTVVQGGSTITQQLAKNLFLTNQKTISRKIQEVLLSIRLEQVFTKEQILTIYINRMYFGAGAYGVDAAARVYFDIPASRLSTYQSALLAGLLRAPSRLNPRNNAELAEERARTVLAGMVDAGFLSRGDADAALRKRHSFRVDQPGQESNRYFVDWVLEQIPAYLARHDQDIIVTTTLDPHLQQIADNLTTNALQVSRKNNATLQVALLSMTADGAVRAMIGGRNYRESQFNRAVQARRQPGSAFKLAVYLAGLESGLSPEHRFVDAPLSIDGWRPNNFTGRFLGEVSLRRALAESINTVAVQVSERASRRKVMEAARRLGITSEMKPHASLALGTLEVSLLELTASYAVIGNGGYAVWPYAIDTIIDASGRLLYERTGGGALRVVAEKHAALMTGMLTEVIDKGTGRKARLTRPAAGKTGTTQSFRDAWFVGFTSDLVTGVWIGNDDERPMTGITGGGLPAELWRSFMADAHLGLPPKPLPLLRDANGTETPGAPAAPPPTDLPNRNLVDRFIHMFATEER
jgi:penicillin-binding protein 1A